MNDTVIIFCAFSCMCRAQLWAESLGVPYSAEWKVVCSDTVIYIMANDEESFNKEMASDSLEWNIMQSPNKKTGVVFLPAGM